MGCGPSADPDPVHPGSQYCAPQQTVELILLIALSSCISPIRCSGSTREARTSATKSLNGVVTAWPFQLAWGLTTVTE
jgi:hypothetical protein